MSKETWPDVGAVQRYQTEPVNFVPTWLGSPASWEENSSLPTTVPAGPPRVAACEKKSFSGHESMVKATSPPATVWPSYHPPSWNQ